MGAEPGSERHCVSGDLVACEDIDEFLLPAIAGGRRAVMFVSRITDTRNVTSLLSSAGPTCRIVVMRMDDERWRYPLRYSREALEGRTMNVMTAGAIEGKRDMLHGRVALGISGCLLGERVRYDGSHKRDVYITDTLGRVFDFLPCCPETAIGMGVPRPPVRLVATARGTRVRGVDDPRRDVTEALTDYGHGMVDRLRQVSGYIFKKGSPSCGVERVPCFTEDGARANDAVGAFAGTVMARLPELPVVEEEGLTDPAWRENFVERVFVYHRWQRISCAGLTTEALVEFHMRHKLVLLAHDETAYRELGRVVANAGKGELAGISRAYIRTLMSALKTLPTTRTHANVLMHILGFFKSRIGSDDKRELLALIDEYRRGRIPRAVPVTAIRRRLRRHPHDYLARQYYLDPDPRESMLRDMT